MYSILICLVIMFPNLFIHFLTSTPKFAANGLEHVVTVLWSWQAVSRTFVTMPALKIKGKMGTQKSVCVCGKGMWHVAGELGQRISQGSERSVIRGRGRTTSCSPVVELLVRLKSSSATQEKLQYPLGTLATFLPPNGLPVKTANPDFNSWTQDTHKRTCLPRQWSHWLMILWWDYLGRLLAIGNIKCCSHCVVSRCLVQLLNSTHKQQSNIGFTFCKRAWRLKCCHYRLEKPILPANTFQISLSCAIAQRKRLDFSPPPNNYWSSQDQLTLSHTLNCTLHLFFRLAFRPRLIAVQSYSNILVTRKQLHWANEP